MLSSTLKKKLKELDYDSEEFRIRLHRAISWLHCAEKQSGDPDIKYLSLWIAFNSCYALDLTEKNQKSEREKFRKFISTLVTNDFEERIAKLLWDKFSGPIRLLINNPYVFKAFWDFHRGEALEWEYSHKKSVNEAMRYVSANKTASLLEIILDRLYVLRNQLMHGGATYKSKINRSQLVDGTRILEMLVPVIVDIMLQNPEQDWGKILYPVIK
jgi:hypothetical protein